MKIGSRANFDILSIIALTILFTSGAINYSKKEYRLAVEPYYDDIGYFNDADQRLSTVYHDGLAGLARSLVVNPPHSPWSTLAALSGFAAFGINDAAPYAVNGLLIFVMLGGVFYLGRDVSLSVRLLASAFVLSAPLTLLGVIEFRPDFCSALFLALTTGFLLFRTPDRELLNRQECIAAGLLASCALLAKPTAIPANGILVLAALALYASSSGQRTEILRAKCLRALGIFAIVIAATAWFYAISFRVLYGYIVQNFADTIHHKLYHIDSLRERLGFFIDGVGGIQLSGHYIYIAGLIVTALLIRRPEASAGFRTATAKALFWILISYLGTSLAGLANQFVGLSFQIMLLLTGCYALYYLIGWLDFKGRRVGARILGSALVLSAISTGFPPGHARYQTDEVKSILAINHQLMARLTVLAKRHPDATVTFLSIGINANPDTFAWLFRRAHLALKPGAEIFPEKISDVTRAIDSSDIVITSDPGVIGLFATSGNSSSFPWFEFLQPANIFLKKSNKFILAEKISAGPSGFYYIYNRVNF